MFLFRAPGTVLAAWLALACAAFGQEAEPPALAVTVEPPDGAVLITETTNVITVTVGNFAAFTNLAVSGTAAGRTIAFVDDGEIPDEEPDDGIYVGRLTTPFTENGTILRFRLTVIGTDLASVTNEPPVDPPLMATNRQTLDYVIVPRPPNDKFTNAFKIAPAGETILATNHYASLDPGEPPHAGLATADTSVWWNWSAPAATNVLVDLAGSDWPAVLAVYRGEAVGRLTLVGASTNDVARGLPPNVAFPAVKGATYRIAVSGLASNSYGGIRLRVAVGATPDNRPPAVSIRSPDPDSLVTGDAVILSGTARELGALDSGVSNVVVRVNGGAFTNAVGAEDWAAVLRLPPGTNVIEAVAVDYAGNRGAGDTIVVRYVNPTNDLFAIRGALEGLAGAVNAINGRATREAGEPLHAGNEGGRSVWYSWRAPADGQFRLTTAGSGFDTLLAVYTGAALGTLAPVAANDDVAPGDFTSEVIFPAVSNQVYQVAVDGFGAASGDITLGYVFTPQEPARFYTVTVPAAPGGTVTPPGGVYPEGSLATLAAIPEPNHVFDGWSGAVTGDANPIAFAVTTNLAVRARFRLVGVTDDFESGTLTRIPWQTTGTNAWRVTTSDFAGGLHAARSAPLGDGRSSVLTLVTNTGAGSLSFVVRVSSEPTWDYLEFVLNGTPRRRWSGEVPWELYSLPVAAGTNRLEWRYVKDGNFGAGLDAAFLDDVYVPPAANDAAPPVLALSPGIAGVVVTLTGTPGRTHVIEASDDLAVWSVLAVAATDDGVLSVPDPGASADGNRFYRGRTQ